MKVFMITSEWPDAISPTSGSFVVRQVKKLRERGVDVTVFHLRGSRSIINYFKAWLNCRKILKSEKFDVIHAQWGQSALAVVPPPVPLVITYRGDDVEGIVNRKGKHGFNSILIRKITDFTALFADHQVFVSKHMMHKKATGSPISLIPSGIDFSGLPSESKEALRRKHNFPADKKIIIFPSNPKYLTKRYDLANGAYQSLPEDLKKNTHFLTVHSRPHQEVLELIKACDLLLFTSMTEGSPNIVKEAIVLNTPVVSVDVADVRSRIGNIPGCFVSPSYSIEDIATQLKKALDYDYTGYSSVETADDLNEDMLADRLIDVYRNLIIKT